MRICPKCQRSRRSIAVVETDKKTKKKWIITKCMICSYNFDIEEADNGDGPDKEVGFFKRSRRRTDD